MSAWHAYPKIYAIGHPQLDGLFDGPVLVEEKIDGSQFSFGVFEGQLRTRSRSQEFPPDAPPSLFQLACNTVVQLAAAGRLTDGWAYRGELLAKPKHNTLAYDRVPVGNVILFDIETSAHRFLPPDEKCVVANALGLEIVPVHFHGLISDPATLIALTENTSCPSRGRGR